MNAARQTPGWALMRFMRVRNARALTWPEWRVAVQAAMLTLVAAPAVSVARVDRAVRMVAALPGPGVDLPIPRTAAIVDAVTTVLGASCLTRAMVLHAVLARQGSASTVVIGAARDGERMRAHAWVERDGQVVSVDGADGCVPLCRLDAARPRRVPVA